MIKKTKRFKCYNPKGTTLLDEYDVVEEGFKVIKKIKRFKWYSPKGTTLLGEYDVVGDGSVISIVYGNILSCPDLKTEEELLEFMTMRVTPPSQEGIEEFLSNLELEEYNVEDIFIKTKGAMLTDGSYADIEFKEESME